MRTCAVCDASIEGAHALRKYCIDHAYVGSRRRDQVNARQHVYIAVRSGILPCVRSLICVDCGDEARAYDHRDYSKPLDVSPVCVRCNQKRGAAYPYRVECVGNESAGIDSTKGGV